MTVLWLSSSPIFSYFSGSLKNMVSVQRNPNSELKIINIVKFNVFVKNQTQLNRYNSELKPPTSKF